MEEPAAVNNGMVNHERLPRDVIPLILINLPPKDLLRFKSVSKPWNALISNPSFILTHQSHLSAIRQQSVEKRITPPSLLLTVSDMQTGSVHPLQVSLDTVTNTVSTCLNVYASLVLPDTSCTYFRVIMGPSVGVFCMISYEGDVTLWNPATKEVRNVFRFEADQSYDVLKRLGSEGYGFLCICDEKDAAAAAADFRVVKFYSPKENNLAFEFDTYSLSTNLWTTRRIPRFFSCTYIVPNSVELNGTLHWYVIGFKGVAEPDPFILTCDLSSCSPTFTKNDVPLHLYLESPIDDYCLTKWDNKYLCFTIFKHLGQYFEIWVMKKYGVADSWVRKLRMGPMSNVVRFYSSGVLNNLGTYFIFRDDQNNLRWVINNMEHKISPGVKWDHVNVFDYVESVMPINGIRGRMQLTHVIHGL